MNVEDVLAAVASGDATPLDGFSASDWEQLARAVRHGAVSREALSAVAAACAGRPDAVPVLTELTSDLGVALAVSRALLTEDSVAQLDAILDETGLRDAIESIGPPERLVLPLARTLSEPRAWMWAARGLFHSSVVGILPELVRDSDSEVRLIAVKSLGDTDSDQATEALFTALHDHDNAVQRAALESLEPRCVADPGLRVRLDRELSELTQLVEAPPTTGQLVRRIPGMSRLLSALKRE
jgi:hypothetical protein